jgi:hypothetical protein
MRKYCLFFILSLSLSLFAEPVQTYLDYINQYKAIALDEQSKYGIPASITLAQGILESAAGKSELAMKANNHFGIKCAGDWTGPSYAHDDDAKNECFRKYAHPKQSYEDHSKFLLRKRYQPLFQYPITDYKAWAKGLSQCGYATDPNYPSKLIRIIEEYELHLLTADEPADFAWVNAETTANNLPDTIHAIDTTIVEDLPDFQEVASMGSVSLYHGHQSGKQNGVRYLIADEGDTFQYMAYQLNMNEKTLRRYNDATDGRELKKGDRVYLYKKKKVADRKHTYYYVKKGDTAWSIAQQMGIQMKSIYQINGIPEGVPLVTRQKLRLR